MERNTGKPECTRNTDKSEHPHRKHVRGCFTYLESGVRRRDCRPWAHEGKKLELAPPDKVSGQPCLQKTHGSEKSSS